MNTHHSTLIRRWAGATLALLLVAGMLPQPSLARDGPATPARLAAPPGAVQPVTEQEPAAGVQPAAAPNCNNPLPGVKARLFAEDEVLVNYRHRDDNTSLRSLILDNSGSNLVATQNKYYGALSALSSVRRLGLTAADLNGDGKVEQVSLLRDKSKRIAATSNIEPFLAWYADGSAYKGDDLDWVSAASGNLDRSSASPDEEVAAAFEDENDDIRVIVLDGQVDGRIQAGSNNMIGVWYDPNSNNGRGNVSYVSSAVGDLNGDGYDDEIVTAFRDGNNDLQLLVLRRNNDGTMTLLWNRSWTKHDRGDVAKDATHFRSRNPISVTTGDVDGDLRDEVIIGFRSGDGDDGDVQLLVVDMTREVKGATQSADKFEMDDRVYVTQSVRASNHWAEAPTVVSVSAADLNGDGRAEIAVGYNTVYYYGEHDIDHYWEQHLVTYRYVGVNEPGWNHCTDDAGGWRACLEPQSGHWKSGRTSVPFGVDENNIEAAVSIATGDLDLDGKAEIALGRQDHGSGDLQVYTFDADDGLHQRTEYTVSSGSNRIEDFRVAMGDQDGDSWYGTYVGGDGACRLRKDAQVTAVLHAPPHWPEVNDEEALAGFGQSSSSGSGTGETAETAVSASVTGKWQVKEIGPSFTHEWEKSSAIESQSMTTTVEGTKFSTHPPYLYPEEPYFGAVEFVETPSWCYDYTEPHLGLMTVCLPRPTQESAVLNYPLEWWYEMGREVYAESWVPVGINLAQGRSASQSGVANGGSPERAVDGNRNGDFNSGSVTHTNYAAHPWWQVDLGGEQWLDAVQIWNRTDCCGERLSNFYIFVSDAPFTSDDPNVLLADPNVWNHSIAGQAGHTATVPVNRHGRYVRVELAGANYLQLAEIEVYGMPGAVDQWPTGQPVASSAGFQLNWPNGLQQVVNGQVLYARTGPGLAVRVGSGAADFDLGLEREGEFVQEGSSSDKNTLGWEFRHAAGEASLATTTKTAYILSWSKATEFSGAAGGLPKNVSAALNYAYMPYVWLQRSQSVAGINQVFLVLDYWVPAVGSAMAASAPTGNAAGDAAGDVEYIAGVSGAPAVSTGPTPQTPLVDSPTHPDPNTWVLTNTATLTWAQPPGDPALVEGYHWYLDQVEGASPAGLNLGLETTANYYELADGLWQLHVRALGDNGQWSETGQRTIRVDANPPQVQMAFDPPVATGNNGWYVTPVTITVLADDGGGSGVSAVEVSPDGVNWQPYLGPRVFDADTPGITVYARAADAVGQVSAPVTATFKIDRTAPDSHVAGGQGPGVWSAQVITNSLGNQELALTGIFADALSGRGGMSIRYDGTDWTAVEQLGDWLTPAAQPELNWSFSGGRDLGAGYHIFEGRAQDVAGNQEAAYEIGRVLWFPQAAPELGGSTLAVSPARVSPGQAMTFTLTARNAGLQEASVAMSAVLPTGLELITDMLAPDVTYDPASGVITWLPHLLWPGGFASQSFAARAASDASAGPLTAEATLHAFWPNSDLLPPEQRQPFQAQERTVQVSATVNVQPALPVAADVIAPWVSLDVGTSQLAGDAVPLGIVSTPDAAFLYLREWTLNGATGAWEVAQDSGWINYTPAYTWTLSSGQGVKYVGVWVADANGNISTLDEDSLGFVNRADADQTLSAGQRVQYRGDLEEGLLVLATLTTLGGDPDLYIWRPGNGFRPDFSSNDSVAVGQTESLGSRLLERTGRFLLEVAAVGDSIYRLSLAGPDSAALAAAAGVAEKAPPTHPLTLSDPLSANQLGLAPGSQPHTLYLPIIRH